MTSVHSQSERRAYTLAEVQAALAGVKEKRTSKRGTNPAPRIRRPRHELSAPDYLNQCACDHLDDWVPQAFPAAEKHATGAWRVRSADLGRSCEEDLSIAPIGIQDFGQEWDERVGYTPVGLLQAFFETVTEGRELEPASEFDEFGKPNGTLAFDDACQWLAERLGLSWDELRAADLEIAFADPPFEAASFDNLDPDGIRRRAAELAMLKFGWPEMYDEVASRLSAGMTRQELDRVAEGGRQPNAGTSLQRPLISATPFVWRDPTTLEPRAWLYGHHFIRKYLSATIAPGGLGKSSLLVAEAIAMVSGANLLGEKPTASLRVWYWNGEDPIDEIERRITAACVHHAISPDQLDGRLFVNSGRDTEIVVARETRNGVEIARPLMAALRQTIVDNSIDVVIIDPFVASHAVSENDNGKINAVCRQWAMLADETGCAVELVHHVRKAAPGQGEFAADDARGAGAMLAAVRSARVLNAMTKDDAAKAGVETPREFFRVDKGKVNLTPPAHGSTWRRIVNVPLGNGQGPSQPGDYVGVVTEWRWPDPSDDVTDNDIRAVQDAISRGEWRESVQAKDWVGKAVAEALGLDLDEPSAKATVRALLRTWLERGFLKFVDRRDASRKLRTFVLVGKWVQQ